MSILKNKKALILSSLLILLPIPVGLILWNRFPETIAIHFGIDWQADGYGSVPFAVFVPSLLLLAVHWLCIFFTTRDPGNKDRNAKPLSLVLWIIPLIGNLCCGLMYTLALGVDVSVERIMGIALGLMFAAIGNYLPKCKMNSTMGIKIPWTYSSEENWNATHRFAGKVWVIGGIAASFSALIPGGWGIAVLLITMFTLCIIPMVYSYCFYKQELAAGKQVKAGYSATDKKLGKASGIFLAAILIFVAVVMFTGDIDFLFREDSLLIDSSIYTDHIIYFNAIDGIELREGNIPSRRVGGFASARLLMGYFVNEEFGTYIRYTYTNPENCIVLEAGGRKHVLSGRTAEDTQEIYEKLLEQIN